jgi:hypothetical protein
LGEDCSIADALAGSNSCSPSIDQDVYLPPLSQSWPLPGHPAAAKNRYNAANTIKINHSVMAGILLEGDHVTDEERAAHACALAVKEREKLLKRATEVKARVGANQA